MSKQIQTGMDSSGNRFWRTIFAHKRSLPCLIFWIFLLIITGPAVAEKEPTGAERQQVLDRLKQTGFKLLYESRPEDNWELFIADADGSGAVNITQTPEIDEFYGHVSLDGKQIVFMAEQGPPSQRRRDVYRMNIDGTGRTEVAQDARQGCWDPTGRRIAYMKGPGLGPVKYHVNRGLFLYDLQSGVHKPHPRGDLENLVNLNFSPDGRWIIATVFAGMGYGQAILAIQTDGQEIIELIRQDGTDPLLPGILGCRGELNPDGTQIAWCVEQIGRQSGIQSADCRIGQKSIQIQHPRAMLRSILPGYELYHPDWSPDGKYLAISRGPQGPLMESARFVPGQAAPGWDICILETEHPGVFINLTQNGLSNKEPDWFLPRPEQTESQVP